MSREVHQLKFWPAQKDYWEHGPSPIFFLGGVGSGKTYIGILKILYLLDEYPGSRALLVRQRFNQLRKTILPTVLKLLPPESIARRNDNEGILKLTNGSELVFMHLDREDSIDNLKSMEINFFYVDQCEDISVVAWDTLIERLGRWSGAKKRGGWPSDWPYHNRLGENIPPRYAMASGYSPGYDHWLTARFWEHGQERELYRNRGYKYIRGSTRDNLALSDEYIADRLAQGDEYIRRYVDGLDWGAREGRIFNLDPRSIIEPTEEIMMRIKRTMRLHRVLDHGEVSPTCCLWYATDADQNVIFYREYYAADKLVSEHRAAIYQLSKDDNFGSDPEPPRYYSNLADPAIFAKNRGRAVNARPEHGVADEYAERRVVDAKTAIFWNGANNEEVASLNRIREYLRVDGIHRNPFTGKRGAPRLYFLRRTDEFPYGCYQTMVDIRSARRVEVGIDSNGNKLFGDDRDEKVPDHALDCFVGETLVDTPAGPVRIDQLPREGSVCTPVGIQRYTDCMRYNTSSVVTVHVSDGRKVTCTPKHQFLTPQGWVAAQHLANHAILLSSPRLSSRSWESALLNVVSTTSGVIGKVSAAFIDWFGRHTVGLFPSVATFTTLTTTGITTPFLTWLSKPQATTHDIITLERNTRPGLPSTPPPHGTVHRPDGAGIDNTLGPCLQSDLSRYRKIVNGVAKVTRRFATVVAFLSSALRRVKPLTFVNVTQVTPAGTADVYCLTVHHPLHSFTVEGGLAAHNCVRYALNSRPALGPVETMPEPEPGTIRYSDYERLMEEEDRRAKAEFQARFVGRSIGG